MPRSTTNSETTVTPGVTQSETQQNTAVHPTPIATPIDSQDSVSTTVTHSETQVDNSTDSTQIESQDDVPTERTHINTQDSTERDPSDDKKDPETKDPETKDPETKDTDTKDSDPKDSDAKDEDKKDPDAKDEDKKDENKKDEGAKDSENETPRKPSEESLDTVVYVSTIHFKTNHCFPYRSKIESVHGTGFLISGRRILTCFHCIKKHVGITIKRRGSERAYAARFLAGSYEWDLALITVDDDAFWKKDNYLTFGPLPKRKEELSIMTYNMQDEEVTHAIHTVKDIHFASFYDPIFEFLNIVVDPTLEAGNSGSPFVNDKDEVVGVGFGEKREKGMLIPSSNVEHFLGDVEKHGNYSGFCDSGFNWQILEHETLRNFKKMKPEETGVLISLVLKTSPAYHVLRQGDVVLAVDDTPIANDGTIEHEAGEDVTVEYVFNMKYVGEEVKVKIIRDGERVEVKYELGDSFARHLVPYYVGERQPHYYFCAGIVFIALSKAYIEEVEDGDECLHLLRYYADQYKQCDDDEVVVISTVINVNISIDYGSIYKNPVDKFNGVKLRNLKHLAQLVDSCEEDFFRFDLHGQLGADVLVLGREEAKDATAKFMELECISTHTNIKGVDDAIAENGFVSKTTEGSGG